MAIVSSIDIGHSGVSGGAGHHSMVTESLETTCQAQSQTQCNSHADDFPGSAAASWAELNNYRRTVLSPRGPKQRLARLVLLSLLSFAQPGKLLFPSQKSIAERASICERSARTYLKQVGKDGWFRVRRRYDRATGWPRSVYTLTIPPLPEAPGTHVYPGLADAP
jgi:hypothetical protein